MVMCNHVFIDDTEKVCPYPGLFRKWKRWQEEGLLPKKFESYDLNLPVDGTGKCLFHSKKKELQKKFSKFYSELVYLSNWDKEIEEITLEELFFPKMPLIKYKKPASFINSQTALSASFNLTISGRFTRIKVVQGITKRIIFDLLSVSDTLAFDGKDTGEISFGNQTAEKIRVSDVKITIQNTDLGKSDYSTRKFLQEMDKNDRLELIDCEWSGLEWIIDFVPDLGRKLFSKRIELDERTLPLKTLIKQHLDFFEEFIELTEGKKVQIRVTSENKIIYLEVFSLNGITGELVEKKYNEYINYTLGEGVETKEITFDHKIDEAVKSLSREQIAYQKGLFLGQKENLESFKKIIVDQTQLLSKLIEKTGNTEINYSSQSLSNSPYSNQFSGDSNQLTQDFNQNYYEFSEELAEIIKLLQDKGLDKAGNGQEILNELKEAKKTQDTGLIKRSINSAGKYLSATLKGLKQVGQTAQDMEKIGSFVKKYSPLLKNLGSQNISEIEKIISQLL
jgi:hypothetical protein